MASRKPAFVLKNCSIAIEGDVRIGQAKTMTMPVLERKVEEMRNAGMIKPREVALGYEKTEASFTETAFDPGVMNVYGLRPNRETNLIIYGYLEDEGTGAEHAARCECVAMFKKMDAGDWTPGEAAETQYELAVHEFRLFVDDQIIYEVDDFSVSINGVTEHPGLADALRLN